MLNYLLLLGLIISLGLLILSPSLGLFLLGFSTPAINWTIYFKGLEIPFSDLIAVVVTLAWLLALFYQLAFKPGLKIKIKFPLFFPFFCFLLANLLSLLNSPHALSGLYYIIRWLILLYLAYIFLPLNTIRREATLKIAIWGLATASLLVTISGYLSLWGQDIQNSFFRVNSISWWGTYPFGSNHNLIAEFLGASAFLWLALKEFTESKRAKRVYSCIFVLMLIAAVLTFSRTAWITIALQLIIYVIWRNHQYIKKQGGLVIITMIGIALLILPIVWRMKILQADNISSTENRILLTEIAYQNWEDKPILGQGSGRFTELVADNIRFTAKYGAPIDSHGFFQKIIAETGVVGLAAWLFLLAVITQKALSGLKKYDKSAPWLLPLWIGAGGGLFFQIFNTSYYKGKVWLFIALALIATELARQKYDRKD